MFAFCLIAPCVSRGLWFSLQTILNHGEREVTIKNKDVMSLDYGKGIDPR